MNDEPAKTGADIEAVQPKGAARPFEHPVLSEPTELLAPACEVSETLEHLLQSAARWAEVQGSNMIRLPHLFAALLGAGTHARWEWLRAQALDTETIKQKILLMVPAQSNARTVNDPTSVSDSVQTVLERARHKAQLSNRSSANVDDVFWAFFSEDAGAVGDQLRKWGLTMPGSK